MHPYLHAHSIYEKSILPTEQPIIIVYGKNHYKREFLFSCSCETLELHLKAATTSLLILFLYAFVQINNDFTDISWDLIRKGIRYCNIPLIHKDNILDGLVFNKVHYLKNDYNDI